MKAVQINREDMDPEWIDLLKSAYELGITVEEVRSFLAEFKQQGSLKPIRP
ncbi:anti-repressor SinI family protein [Paenibacillus swuensis]|uniref:anti-repressor SinI family protein n=1 Tax=Paenibacillus swuensis TaxID=1178515 RepID=UPI0009ED471B|nr:anti-repressor SinI family protein [Paenibacillus swuensis]